MNHTCAETKKENQFTDKSRNSFHLFAINKKFLLTSFTFKFSGNEPM